jgi:alkanesulfonate monooxygenase SsuD/methylene tetrahydromethanopterin reductase-like flavin-dependent oxidoreductase (luciferase family)
VSQTTEVSPAGLLFGVNIPTTVDGRGDPVAAAVRAEQLGFDFVSASDHPCGTDPTYETWTMLSFIAAATSRIRVATRVLGVPYRPPPIVAKMAESLDRLSGGRLILGLGGGSADDEHRAFGLGVRSPKEKTDGLEEAVTIIRGLWSDPTFTFAGRLYHTDGAALEPKPRHRIPIWLGTFAPRALTVTGRLADGWIPSLGYASPDEVVVMRERVLQAAREAGRDPAELTCVYNVEVRIDEGAAAEADVVAGSASAVVEQLREFVHLGFSGFNFMPHEPAIVEQTERLARDVVPALRRRFEEGDFAK